MLLQTWQPMIDESLTWHTELWKYAAEHIHRVTREVEPVLFLNCQVEKITKNKSNALQNVVLFSKCTIKQHSEKQFFPRNTKRCTKWCVKIQSLPCTHTHTLPPLSISVQTQLYWAVWPRSSRKFPQQAARTSRLSVGGDDKDTGSSSGLWLITRWARSSQCNVQYAVPGQVLQPGKQERVFRLSSQGQPTSCPLWYSRGHSDVLWQSFGWVVHYAGQWGCNTTPPPPWN